jgi:hypothetical protein
VWLIHFFQINLLMMLKSQDNTGTDWLLPLVTPSPCTPRRPAPLEPV